MPARVSHPYRVLMSADAVGGVWTYVIDLARGLTSLGAEVRLAVLGPAPSPQQVTTANSVPRLDVVVTGLPLDWTAASEQQLDDAAEWLQADAARWGADLVHLNAPAHAGRQPWPLPLVTAAHSCVATWWEAVRGGPLPPDLAWRSARTEAGLRISDAVIAPSRSFASALSHAYGGGLPLIAIPNSSSMEIPAAAEPREIIFTAGRLWDPAKNVSAVDSAAARSGLAIHAAGPLTGPNGERITLRCLSHLGPLAADEMAACYARTRIFVSPARYEPFGLSVLEAARAGAALVLSDIPTFRELWSGAATFVASDNASALAAVLSRLDADPGHCAALGARAFQRSRMFSAQRQLARTLTAHRLAFAAAERRRSRRAA